MTESARRAAAAASTRDGMMGVLAFFALLKIMVTYISFNEENYRFLLPSLYARSFVSNEINAAPKQWILAFYQSTWGKKKGTRTQQCARGENESRSERTSEREVVFALFFMEAKSLSRFRVVISISNYPIPKRLHPFGETSFPSKRRART